MSMLFPGSMVMTTYTHSNTVGSKGFGKLALPCGTDYRVGVVNSIKYMKEVVLSVQKLVTSL